MQETRGEYLRNKSHNMRLWLEKSLPGETAVDSLPIASEIQAMWLAECLLEVRDAVSRRDFGELREHEALTVEWRALLHVVEAHEEMHEKFWRYLTLFVEVAGYQRE